MLWPLFTMVLAFTTLFFTLHLAAIRNEILRRRLRRLSILEASSAERDEPAFGALGRHGGLIAWSTIPIPASSLPLTSSRPW